MLHSNVFYHDGRIQILTYCKDTDIEMYKIPVASSGHKITIIAILVLELTGMVLVLIQLKIIA
jgi:hypothetical protein